MNKVILIGNVGQEPECRTLENGVKVAVVSLATNESFKDKQTGERKTQTEWHRIVLWRGLAEITEKYVEKGALIAVEGKLAYRSYQDQTGNTRYTTEIVGKEMRMLSGRRAPEPLGKGEVITPVVEEVPADDLPF